MIGRFRSMCISYIGKEDSAQDLKQILFCSFSALFLYDVSMDTKCDEKNVFQSSRSNNVTILFPPVSQSQCEKHDTCSRNSGLSPRGVTDVKTNRSVFYPFTVFLCYKRNKTEFWELSESQEENKWLTPTFRERHILWSIIALETKQMPFQFISKLASSVQSSKDSSQRRTPHRLYDDLHWKCPACKSKVPTRSTSLHLFGCLMSVIEPVSGLQLGKHSSSINSLIRTIELSGSLIIDPKDRPQVVRPKTRVLLRPNPHIKHPVIETDDDKRCSNQKTNNKNSVNKELNNKSEGMQNTYKRLNNKKQATRAAVEDKDVKTPASTDTSQKSSETTVQPTKRTEKPRIITRAPYNDPGWTQFKSKLSPCSKCNRSFFHFRVAAHEKYCDKSDKIQKTQGENRVQEEKTTIAKREQEKVEEMSPEQKEEWEAHLNQLKACKKCRRTFFPHRLKVHEKSCHADPVAWVKPLNAKIRSSVYISVYELSYYLYQ